MRTRSEALTRVSRRESFLMFMWWNSMRWAQGRALSRRWLILSEETSTTMALWEVSAISFSQRWDPMNPPPPIMHIDTGGIGFPSKFTRAIFHNQKRWFFELLLFSCAVRERRKKLQTRKGKEKRGCGSYNWFSEDWRRNLEIGWIVVNSPSISVMDVAYDYLTHTY